MSPEVEDEFAALWARGVPLKKISRLLGYSLNYLYEYVRKRRDKFPHRHKQFSKRTREAMGDAMRQGKTTPQRVAEVLEINIETARKWAKDGQGRADQVDGKRTRPRERGQGGHHADGQDGIRGE